MKKELFTLTAAFAVISASGALPDNIKGYTDICADGGQKIVYSNDFERPQRLNPKFKIVKGEGFNGNAGMVYEAKEPRQRADVQLFDKIPLDPSCKYRFTLQFRHENAVNHDTYQGGAHKNKTCIGAVEFRRDGKIKEGRYKLFDVDAKNTDWQTFVLDFTSPGRYESARIAIYWKATWTGTLTMDNMEIVKQGENAALIYPVSPAALRIPADGKVRFFVDNFGRNSKNAFLCAELNGKLYTAPINGKYGEITFKNFVKGENKVRLTVANPDKKQLYGWTDIKLFSRDNTPAVGVCADGTLKLADGKPFIPVGIFINSSRLRTKHLPVMKKGGFDYVMIYSTDNMALQGRTKDRLNDIVKSLDVIHKHGMKAIFALNGRLKSRKNHCKFGGANDYENSMINLAAALSNHPGMLGWYISDENPLYEMGEVKLLRELLTTGDPNHPVFTLTNKAMHTSAFAATGDVLMTDKYPFVDDTTHSLELSSEIVNSAMKTGIAVHMVPQAFHWGGYRQPYNKFRYPTIEEMRTQVLQALVLGTRGMWFYAFDPIFDMQEKADPGSSKKFWPEVTAVAAMVKEFEPYFLSKEKAPEITVKNSGKSIVSAKAFTFKGKTIVVVTAEGPGDINAELTVPSKFISRYGKVKQENGKAVFKGINVDSDVLILE